MGALAGTLKPVSKKQIVEQVADHFVLNEGKSVIRHFDKLMKKTVRRKGNPEEVILRCQTALENLGTKMTEKATNIVKT